MLVDCGVVDISAWAVRSNSPARSQITTSILPPPLEKSAKIPLQNEATTPSPSHSSPRPCIRLLIAVFLRLMTGRCGLILTNYDLYPTLPPPDKSTKIPFEKRRCHAIPRPIQPPPPHTLVDCGVIEVGNRVVWSNSPAQSQIKTSILPPQPKYSTKIPFEK